MPKLFIILTVIFFSLGVCCVATAYGKELSGYTYSDNAGWISLNCSNTNSCNSIYYKVLQDDSGNLSGYGYSEKSGWVNLSPNFGGITADLSGNLSGWAFSENLGWLKISNSKNISALDLQNELSSAESLIVSADLSNGGAITLLNNLCHKFLSADDCSKIGQ